MDGLFIPTEDRARERAGRRRGRRCAGGEHEINPAVDIMPAARIAAFVTELGVLAPLVRVALERRAPPSARRRRRSWVPRPRHPAAARPDEPATAPARKLLPPGPPHERAADEPFEPFRGATRPAPWPDDASPAAAWTGGVAPDGAPARGHGLRAPGIEVRFTRDRVLLREFLEGDRLFSAYALCDLDDREFARTRWGVAFDGEAPTSVALEYAGPAPQPLFVMGEPRRRSSRSCATSSGPGSPTWPCHPELLRRSSGSTASIPGPRWSACGWIEPTFRPVTRACRAPCPRRRRRSQPPVRPRLHVLAAGRNDRGGHLLRRSASAATWWRPRARTSSAARPGSPSSAT